MNRSAPGGREGGAILIVTLMFLVILTLLGVTAMTSTTMEERMAGNTRDASVALQAAESALRDARRDVGKRPVVVGRGRSTDYAPSEFGINGAPGTCGEGDKKGLCYPANNKDGSLYETKIGSIMPSFPGHSLLADPSVKYGEFTGAPPIGGADNPTPATQPRYIVEGYCLMPEGVMSVPQCSFYRVTARGYGRNPNTQVTLQETFVTF